MNKPTGVVEYCHQESLSPKTHQVGEIPLSYTYSEYPLDTGYFPLWILSLMLRYY